MSDFGFAAIILACFAPAMFGAWLEAKYGAKTKTPRTPSTGEER